jgi:hypothetical protein
MIDASALELLRMMVGAYLRLFAHPSAEDRALVVLWGAGFPTMAAVEGMVEAIRLRSKNTTGFVDARRRRWLRGNSLEPPSSIETYPALGGRTDHSPTITGSMPG